MAILLGAMLVAMVGVVIGSAGISTNSLTLTAVGSLLVASGFGSFGYVAFYVRLVKFAMLDFYNLLVRITYGQKYFLTFSINDISNIVNDELIQEIKAAIPDFAEKLFKDYQLFLAHHMYTTEGDVVIIASDSPRAISDPQPVEMLLGGWIVKTKVAELTGLELTKILRPIERQLTFFEKLKLKLFNSQPTGRKRVEFTKIPIVFVYDSDITPDLMKNNLFGVPQFAKSASEAARVLEGISKAAIKTLTTPFEQEKTALQDHIGELNRVIEMEKIPYSFTTSEPEVTTPQQKRGDRIKQIVAVLIIASLALAGFWVYTNYVPSQTNYTNTGLPNGNQQSSTSISTYSLTIATRGQGTTTPVPGTYTYQPSSNVALTAIPSQGWNFYEWCAVANPSSSSCMSVYSSPSVNVAVTQNLVLVAIFNSTNSTGGK